MRRVMLLIASLTWLVAGCSDSHEPAIDAGRTSDHRQRADGELTIGEPITHVNLTIFPVVSRTPKTAERFITLDAGLRAGTVEVSELGADSAGDPLAAGPNVDRLLVLNRSEKPLYLMPGEIIIGGRQDRAIGHEYVIPPDKKPTVVDVFCVEHGRWHDRVPLETSALLRAAGSSAALEQSIALSNAAKGHEDTSGKFVGSIGAVSKGARLALQNEKNQAAVWARVAETNSASGAMAPSGAFTANYAESGTIQQLEPYMAAMNKSIASCPRIVGTIVAVNGKVEAMDVFESTPLFLALWPKLLKSYALDAANASEGNSGQACPRELAEQFLANSTAAASQPDGETGNLVLTIRSTDELICFSAHERASQSTTDLATPPAAGTGAGGMGGGMGGLGGSVHASGFAR